MAPPAAAPNADGAPNADVDFAAVPNPDGEPKAGAELSAPDVAGVLGDENAGAGLDAAFDVVLWVAPPKLKDVDPEPNAEGLLPNAPNAALPLPVLGNAPPEPNGEPEGLLEAGCDGCPNAGDEEGLEKLPNPPPLCVDGAPKAEAGLAALLPTAPPGVEG